MNEIKAISNNILKQDESLLPSNITTHDVNAFLWISTALSQGYEMIKKFFEKGAAPPNSIGYINATDVKTSQIQYKDVGNITNYNNTVYNNYTVHVPCTHVLAKNELSRGRKRKSDDRHVNSRKAYSSRPEKSGRGPRNTLMQNVQFLKMHERGVSREAVPSTHTYVYIFI